MEKLSHQYKLGFFFLLWGTEVIPFPLCFEMQIISTNNTPRNYQSIFKNALEPSYTILTKTVHLDIEFCPSHPLTLRLGFFFFNLLPNQNYITANACIVLYFWPCRAVLQASLIGRISVQSLSCALRGNMAFFLPIQIKKDKTTRKNTFIREIKSKWGSFTSFSLAIGLTLVCSIQASANYGFLGHSLFTGQGWWYVVLLFLDVLQVKIDTEIA